MFITDKEATNSKGVQTILNDYVVPNSMGKLNNKLLIPGTMTIRIPLILCLATYSNKQKRKARNGCWKAYISFTPYVWNESELFLTLCCSTVQNKKSARDRYPMLQLQRHCGTFRLYAHRMQQMCRRGRHERGESVPYEAEYLTSIHTKQNTRSPTSFLFFKCVSTGNTASA